jgi:hypothetical protein
MTAAPLPGRQVFRLTDKELYDRADLVVIANAISTLDADQNPEHEKQAFNVPVHTTLEILVMLKGREPRRRVVLLHYRWLSQDREFVNPPRYLVLDPSNRQPPSGKSFGSYLLYLKKGTHGRYEPVTGQIDPIYSVKALKPIEER